MPAQEHERPSAVRIVALAGTAVAAGSLVAALTANPAPRAYVLAHLALGAAFFLIMSSRLRPGPAFILGTLVITMGSEFAQALFYPGSEEQFSNRHVETVLWPGLSAMLAALFALMLLFPRRASGAYSALQGAPSE